MTLFHFDCLDVRFLMLFFGCFFRGYWKVRFGNCNCFLVETTPQCHSNINYMSKRHHVPAGIEDNFVNIIRNTVLMFHDSLISHCSNILLNPKHFKMGGHVYNQNIQYYRWKNLQSQLHKLNHLIRSLLWSSIFNHSSNGLNVFSFSPKII